MKPARVIVTRPEPAASRFAADVATAGLAPIISPAMGVIFQSGAIDLTGVGALAFTSANGVRAIDRLRPKAFPGLAFAVGEATAAEARRAGFDAIAAGGNVASLADAIASASGGRFAGAVLHACGVDQAGDLVAQLEQRGVPAKRAILYEARPLADMTVSALAAFRDSPPAEWVALFSSRSARAFLDQADRAAIDLRRTRAACISEAIAEVARDALWASVEIARERTGAALIRLMRETGGSGRS